MDSWTKGILKKSEEFHSHGPKREVMIPGVGKMALLIAGRRETVFQEIKVSSGAPQTSAVQRLLDSFPIRKNAELTAYVERSELPEPEGQAEGQMAEILALTKNILAKILGPLDRRLIRDQDLLERALERAHPRLPFPFRFVLRKKEYIQLMLDNRERLVP